MGSKSTTHTSKTVSPVTTQTHGLRTLGGGGGEGVGSRDQHRNNNKH